MIGSLIAARFIGKKSWQQSAIFWFILLAIGWLMATGGFGAIVGIFIGIIAFIGIAIYYLKVPIKMSIIMYVAALVINWLISLVISGFGFQLMWW